MLARVSETVTDQKIIYLCTWQHPQASGTVPAKHAPTESQVSGSQTGQASNFSASIQVIAQTVSSKRRMKILSTYLSR